MSRSTRRLLFRICMTVVIPLGHAQARMAHAWHAQRRMDGGSPYLLPLTLACWVPLRLAAIGALWLAVAAAGGADARAIE